MNASDDDRIAYLAGDAVESLSARERAKLDELREQLGDFSTWVEPDAGLEDRIVAAISEEASARPADTTIRAAEHAKPPEQQAGPPAHEAKPARPPRRRFSLNELFRRRPAFAFGGLAAGLAVVAAAIVIATNANNGPKPLHFAMVVTGTPLAPKATGSASLTKTGSGWRIELSATGLPHIGNGRFYQAWLKNAQGILVPIGTFNDPKKVTLWSGVPVTKFRTLTVTLQLANGNPASSGKRVLIGTITPSG